MDICSAIRLRFRWWRCHSSPPPLVCIATAITKKKVLLIQCLHVVYFVSLSFLSNVVRACVCVCVNEMTSALLGKRRREELRLQHDEKLATIDRGAWRFVNVIHGQLDVFKEYDKVPGTTEIGFREKKRTVKTMVTTREGHLLRVVADLIRKAMEKEAICICKRPITSHHNPGDNPEIRRSQGGIEISGDQNILVGNTGVKRCDICWQTEKAANDTCVILERRPVTSYMSRTGLPPFYLSRTSFDKIREVANRHAFRWLCTDHFNILKDEVEKAQVEWRLAPVFLTYMGVDIPLIEQIIKDYACGYTTVYCRSCEFETRIIQSEANRRSRASQGSATTTCATSSNVSCHCSCHDE